MHSDSKQLKDFLISTGLVTRSEYDAIAANIKQKGIKGPIEKVLVHEGKLSSDDLRRAQAYAFGIPFVDLKNQPLAFSVLSFIPEPIARMYNAIAFQKNPDSLEIALLDMDNFSAVTFLGEKLGTKLIPRLTDTASINHALLQYQKGLKNAFGDALQQHILLIDFEKDNKKLNDNLVRIVAQDPHVISIVEIILNHALLQNASDIHIVCLEGEVLVRYRIDGLMHDAFILPQRLGIPIAARIKTLAHLSIENRHTPQYGKFSTEKDGQRVSFHFSSTPTLYGETIVLRVYHTNTAIYSLESLGFQGINLEWVHRALRQRDGMILVAGPVGSGKTTTLYTLLQILNIPQVSIATIEYPIEYHMARVSQTQVKPENGITFANGLRAILKQDPDIIMIGELHDTETVSLGIFAAQSSHLVLSGIHAQSAVGAITQLLDMKADPLTLTSTMEIIIAQRLVRKLATGKKKYILSKAELASIAKLADLDRVLQFLREEHFIKKDDDWTTINFYKAVSSHESHDRYEGNIALYEVLDVSATIHVLIANGAAAEQIEKQARKEGMMTMLEDGLCKCVQGLTTLEEVLKAIV